MQDSDGYMWFGTDMGVSRYNGYEFENFDSKDGLTGNEIFGINEDSQKRIWFLSYNGEFSYYKNGRFYNSYTDSTLAKLKSNSILLHFYEDSEQTVYISSSQTLFCLDLDNNVKKIEFENRIFNTWKNEDNNLTVLTDSGVYSVQEDGGIIKKTNFDLFYTRSLIANDLIIASSKDSLFYIKDSLHFLGGTKNKAVITWVGKSNRNKNNLYIGTRMGMYIYSLAEKKYLSDYYLQESVITQTFEDNQGNLWISTEGEGIFLSTSPSIKVFNQKDNLPLNQITCLKIGVNKELWIGMRNGYYSLLKNGNITNNRLLNHESEAIRKFYISPLNQLAIVSRSNMVIIENDTPKYYNFSVKDVILDSSTVYVAGSKFSIYGLKPFFNTLAKNPVYRPDFFSITKNNNQPLVLARVMEKGENEAIYLGTQQTLYKNDKLKLIDLGKKTNLLQATINDLEYDKKRGLLYVATNGKGIIVLKNDSLECVIDTKKGLSSDNCLTLFLDDSGALLVSTSNGFDLIEYYSNQLYISDYAAYLNLATKRVNDIEKMDGILYLATNNGLLKIDLNQTNQYNYQPPVYLNSVIVNGDEKSISNNGLQLKHSENSIEFHFLGLCYQSLGNITYNYKLEGYHKKWQTTKNRNVVFEALKPGKYTFKLKIEEPKSQKNSIQSFSFIIAIPYWKTAGFILILVFVSSLIIGLILFFRVQRVRKQYELEKKIVLSEIEKLEIEKAYLLAEQKAGVLQMNPHFLFNSLNTIKGFYSQNKFSEANWFISKFSKLLRRILECNTQFIPLDREMEILQIYMELMQKRHDDHFTFTLECAVENKEKIMIPPMILQPIIENAVLHGVAPIENGKVQITFCSENGFFICSVIDNGVGFNNAPVQMHKSLGLSNIEDRLSLLSQQYKINCKLDITSPYNLEKSTGTKVTVYFPIKFTTYESNNN